jgi:hypothetical protein
MNEHCDPLDAETLDQLDADAHNPDVWYSGGGYKYVEVLPEELAALVAEVKAHRGH